MFFPLKLPPGLPVERVTDYRIVLLPDYKPFAHWLYRMFPEEYKELNAQLDQHSADGYIEPARIAARKKGRRLAPLFWLYGLDKYHIPRIDELLDGLQGSKVFSKMDLQQGFLQIRVFPNMWMAQYFRRNLNPINSRWCILACAMQRQRSKELRTWFLTAVARLSPFT